MTDRLYIKMNDQSVDKVIRELDLFRSEMFNASVESLSDTQLTIYERAQAMCPRDTGALSASMYQDLDLEGNTIHAVVGHGGKHNKINPKSYKSTDTYAVERHESPYTSDEARKLGGSWKWLEKAFNLARPEFFPSLVVYYKGVLQGRAYDDIEESLSLMKRALVQQRINSQKARKEKLSASRATKRREKGYDDESYAKWKAAREARLQALRKKKKHPRD